MNELAARRFHNLILKNELREVEAREGIRRKGRAPTPFTTVPCRSLYKQREWAASGGEALVRGAAAGGGRDGGRRGFEAPLAFDLKRGDRRKTVVASHTGPFLRPPRAKQVSKEAGGWS